MFAKNFRVSLMVVALVLGFGIASTAMAAAPSPVTATPIGHPAHLLLFHELHLAHHLLAEADHDYQGHRAKAAEEVHKALCELGVHHAAAVAQNGAAAHAAAKHHEAQSTSDAQLRQARAILERVMPHIQANHPKIAANISAAIAEIDTALSIK